ncbi:hypothetical protein PCC6912_40180 [Chlorogloeopsis fritschii PCC 6912]|uniref:Uncharacterized protein n=1 Tax=Chlorogloeopsis fritschii PCC 6912 TaxID=211165 RepID=A0A3S0XNY5_CHLFR|nr:hypothetical protein [Chlorogloeopsis fritschii]RUR77059.1 hypothetical protein PCC6912_40180 [Chlorogloeopsis fritschii PCC 6912]
MEQQNKELADTLDTLMTAVYIAAQELQEMCPQESGVEAWKGYLLQQALKVQEDMSPQERVRFRLEYLI